MEIRPADYSNLINAVSVNSSFKANQAIESAQKKGQLGMAYANALGAVAKEGMNQALKAIESRDTEEANTALLLASSSLDSLATDIIVNGKYSISYGEDGQVSLSVDPSLEEWRTSQIEAINETNLMSTVKKAAIAKIESMYAETNSSMMSKLSTEAVKQLNQYVQNNLETAKGADVKALSFEGLKGADDSTAYSAGYSYIDGLPNITSFEKTILKQQYKTGVDEARASSMIDNAVKTGGMDKAEEVARWFSETYQIDDSNIEKYLNNARIIGNNLTKQYETKGDEAMSKGLSEGMLGGQIIEDIKTQMEGLPQTYIDAAVDSATQRFRVWASNKASELTFGYETMSLEDLTIARDDLIENKGIFAGGGEAYYSSALAKFDSALSAYGKAEQESAKSNLAELKNTVAMNNKMIDMVFNDFMVGNKTGQEAIDAIWEYAEATPFGNEYSSDWNLEAMLDDHHASETQRKIFEELDKRDASATKAVEDAQKDAQTTEKSNAESVSTIFKNEISGYASQLEMGVDPKEIEKALDEGYSIEAFAKTLGKKPEDLSLAELKEYSAIEKEVWNVKAKASDKQEKYEAEADKAYSTGLNNYKSMSSSIITQLVEQVKQGADGQSAIRVIEQYADEDAFREIIGKSTDKDAKGNYTTPLTLEERKIFEEIGEDVETAKTTIGMYDGKTRLDEFQAYLDALEGTTFESVGGYEALDIAYSYLGENFNTDSPTQTDFEASKMVSKFVQKVIDNAIPESWRPIANAMKAGIQEDFLTNWGYTKLDQVPSAQRTEIATAQEKAWAELVDLCMEASPNAAQTLTIDAFSKRANEIGTVFEGAIYSAVTKQALVDGITKSTTVSAIDALTTFADNPSAMYVDDRTGTNQFLTPQMRDSYDNSVTQIQTVLREEFGIKLAGPPKMYEVNGERYPIPVFTDTDGVRYSVRDGNIVILDEEDDKKATVLKTKAEVKSVYDKKSQDERYARHYSHH